MAEPTQFSFELQEVTEALIRKQGIREGRWAMAVQFTFGATLAGPTPNDVRPSALISISRLQLVRVPDNETTPVPFSVDAAELNLLE